MEHGTAVGYGMVMGPEGTTRWTTYADGHRKQETIPPGLAGFGVVLPDRTIECEYCEAFSEPLDDWLERWPALLDLETAHWTSAHPKVNPDVHKPPFCSDGCWGMSKTRQRLQALLWRVHLPHRWLRTWHPTWRARHRLELWADRVRRPWVRLRVPPDADDATSRWDRA